MITCEERVIMNITMRAASPDDMPFITEYINRFRLDNEDLDFRQFIIAADGNVLVGFGRIRPHNEVYELGCIGVVESSRGRGIGRMIVEYLINAFPSDDVYITTDLIRYFERLGFRQIEHGPGELIEKLGRVCRSKCREGAMVMLHRRR